MKEQLKSIPVVGTAAREVARVARTMRFPGSSDYWDRRYAKGGDSGCGSYGVWAEFKAKILNDFVDANTVTSVIEWGCGDGNQLSLAHYPKYTGVDVSDAAIDRCIERFKRDETKSFYGIRSMADHSGRFRADLALSLDVIYHLVEDNVYHTYMRRLFASGMRFVIVYATNDNRPQDGPHVRHREFLPWVANNAPDWELIERRERPGKTDPAETDFFFFARRAAQ